MLIERQYSSTHIVFVKKILTKKQYGSTHTGAELSHRESRVAAVISKSGGEVLNKATANRRDNFEELKI